MTTASDEPGTEPPVEGEPPETKHRKRERVSHAVSRVNEAKRELLDRAEEERRKRKSVRLAYRLVEEDISRGGGLLAGGLAYRLFIWLLPAALFGTSLVGLFSDASNESASEGAADLGLGGEVAVIVQRATEDTERAAPVLLLIGLVAMLWASRSVLKAFRLVSSIAWRMRPPPLQSKVWGPVATSAILLGYVVHSVLAAPFYRGGIVGDVLATVFTLLASIAIAAWCASRLPHPSGVGLFAFIPGAVLFALGLAGMRLAATIYFTGRLDNVDDLYGALGVATIFMAYLYLVARLIVLGLMMNPSIRRSDQVEDEDPMADLDF